MPATPMQRFDGCQSQAPRDLDGYGSVPRSPHRVASSHLSKSRTTGLQEVLYFKIFRTEPKKSLCQCLIPNPSGPSWMVSGMCYAATPTLTENRLSFLRLPTMLHWLRALEALQPSMARQLSAPKYGAFQNYHELSIFIFRMIFQYNIRYIQIP